MDNYLTTQTKSGSMNIYTSSRQDSAKLPVVIVLQEAFGINSHIKNVCQRLASAGYLALAPELYHREGQHVTFDYSEKDRFMPYLGRLNNAGLLEDVQATIEFSQTLPNADNQNLFTMGFCMGGFTSMLSAVNFKLNGAISFYGAGVVNPRAGIGFKPFLELLANSCPLLLFYGEDDISIPEADRFAIRNELDQNHVPHEMLVFGKSDHGFFCDERRTFHKSAADQAWKKSLEWMQSLKR